jgi:hypothetical protein
LDRVNTNYGGKLLSQGKYIMNAQEFKDRLAHHGITLKKVRHHPLHQVMVGGLHESYHPSRQAGKKHIVGCGFFSSMKNAIHGAVKVGKVVAPLAGLVTGNPATGAMAGEVLNVADKALGGNLSGGRMYGGRQMSGGANMSGGKLVKGSAEKKKYMAMLRYRRG